MTQSNRLATYPSFSLLAPGRVGKENHGDLMESTNLAGRTQKIILTHRFWPFLKLSGVKMIHTCLGCPTRLCVLTFLNPQWINSV